MERPSNARRRGLVDIALISVMRDALLRRSEAAAIEWTHIATEPDGSGRLTIPSSKTDQEGEGVVLYLGPPTMRAVNKIRPRQQPLPGEEKDEREKWVFKLSGPTISELIAAAALAAGLGEGYTATAAAWEWPWIWRRPAPPCPSSRRWAAGSRPRRWPGTSARSSPAAASSPSCMPVRGSGRKPDQHRHLNWCGRRWDKSTPVCRRGR